MEVEQLSFFSLTAQPAVPISCIFAAPTLKPEETKNKEATHE